MFFYFVRVLLRRLPIEPLYQAAHLQLYTFFSFKCQRKLFTLTFFMVFGIAQQIKGKRLYKSPKPLLYSSYNRFTGEVSSLFCNSVVT